MTKCVARYGNNRPCKNDVCDQGGGFFCDRHWRDAVAGHAPQLKKKDIIGAAKHAAAERYRDFLFNEGEVTPPPQPKVAGDAPDAGATPSGDGDAQAANSQPNGGANAGADGSEGGHAAPESKLKKENHTTWLGALLDGKILGLAFFGIAIYIAELIEMKVLEVPAGAAFSSFDVAFLALGNTVPLLMSIVFVAVPFALMVFGLLLLVAGIAALGVFLVGSGRVLMQPGDVEKRTVKLPNPFRSAGMRFSSIAYGGTKRVFNSLTSGGPCPSPAFFLRSALGILVVSFFWLFTWAVTKNFDDQVRNIEVAGHWRICGPDEEDGNPVQGETVVRGEEPLPNKVYWRDLRFGCVIRQNWELRTNSLSSIGDLPPISSWNYYLVRAFLATKPVNLITDLDWSAEKGHFVFTDRHHLAASNLAVEHVIKRPEIGDSDQAISEALDVVVPVPRRRYSQPVIYIGNFGEWAFVALDKYRDHRVMVRRAHIQEFVVKPAPIFVDRPLPPENSDDPGDSLPSDGGAAQIAKLQMRFEEHIRSTRDAHENLLDKLTAFQAVNAQTYSMLSIMRRAGRPEAIPVQVLPIVLKPQVDVQPIIELPDEIVLSPNIVIDETYEKIISTFFEKRPVVTGLDQLAHKGAVTRHPDAFDSFAQELVSLFGSHSNALADSCIHAGHLDFREGQSRPDASQADLDARNMLVANLRQILAAIQERTKQANGQPSGNDPAVILIQGGASPTGSSDMNVRLSEQRAEWVRQWLIDELVGAGSIYEQEDALREKRVALVPFGRGERFHNVSKLDVVRSPRAVTIEVCAPKA